MVSKGWTEAEYEISMNFWRRDENLASKSGVQTSVRGKIVNLFSSGSHLVSIVTTQLCLHSMKAAIENV